MSIGFPWRNRFLWYDQELFCPKSDVSLLRVTLHRWGTKVDQQQKGFLFKCAVELLLFECTRYMFRDHYVLHKYIFVLIWGWFFMQVMAGDSWWSFDSCHCYPHFVICFTFSCPFSSCLVFFFFVALPHITISFWTKKAATLQTISSKGYFHVFVKKIRCISYGALLMTSQQ